MKKTWWEPSNQSKKPNKVHPVNSHLVKFWYKISNSFVSGLMRLIKSPTTKQKIIGGLIVIAIVVQSLIYATFYDDKGNSLANSPTNYTIVVVAGQSNAEGTSSFVRSIPPEQALGTHPADDESFIWWRGADGAAPSNAFESLQILTNPGYNPAGWIDSKNADPSMQGLVRMRDLDKPVPVGQRLGQFGPEIGIVRQLYDQGKRNIIVLKVSYGFQALAKTNTQFVPYDWYPDTPGEPSRNKSYGRLMTVYADLTNLLTSKGHSFNTGGIYWLQGETDSLDSGWTETYQTSLDTLVNRLKADLNLHPNGKIILRKFSFRNCLDNAYPATGNYCGFGYAMNLEGASYSSILNYLTINAARSIPLNASRIRTVRQGFQTVADKYDWVDTVETDDLPMAGDHIHFNAAGQLEVGKRMANMFKMP